MFNFTKIYRKHFSPLSKAKALHLHSFSSSLQFHRIANFKVAPDILEFLINSFFNRLVAFGSPLLTFGGQNQTSYGVFEIRGNYQTM